MEIPVPFLPARSPFVLNTFFPLLELVRKKKVSIFEIKISAITEKFLHHLEGSRIVNLKIAEDFVDMVSFLIYTKSKMLLSGGIDENLEELEELFEQDMEKRERLKGIVRVFEKLPRMNENFFLKGNVEFEDEDINLMSFSKVLLDLLKRKGKHVSINETKPRISEKIEFLKCILMEKVIFRWPEKMKDRNENIATFIAMLEIVRTKFASIFQRRPFGSIILKIRK